MPDESLTTVARKPEARSRVTNGKSLFIQNPTPAKLARRFADLVAGASDPEQQLAGLRRRFAALSLASEQLEEQAARGESVDVALLANVAGQINRCAERINELQPKPEVEQPKTHPYWHRPFHVMHDDEFAAYVEQWPDDPNPALVTEKRARAHLADLEARTTPEMRAHQQEMSDRMWGRIPREEGEGSTSSRKEKESKNDEGESADPYAECGVTL